MVPRELTFGAALEVKRETGEKPVRTRHCKYGVSSWNQWSLENSGKACDDMRMYEPGNLPWNRYWNFSGSRVIDRTVYAGHWPCVFCALLTHFGFSGMSFFYFRGNYREEKRIL